MIPQLSIEASDLVWGCFLFLYSISAFFHRSPTRKLISCYCFISCALGLAIFHTSHILSDYIAQKSGMMLAVGHFMYSIADLFICFLIYKAYGNRVTKLSIYFIASVLTHSVAISSDIMGFNSFFYVYEYIMVFINLLILMALFHGSFGHRIIHKCWLYCLGFVCSGSDVQTKKIDCRSSN